MSAPRIELVSFAELALVVVWGLLIFCLKGRFIPAKMGRINGKTNHPAASCGRSRVRRRCADYSESGPENAPWITVMVVPPVVALNEKAPLVVVELIVMIVIEPLVRIVVDVATKFPVRHELQPGPDPRGECPASDGVAAIRSKLWNRMAHVVNGSQGVRHNS
jgi:hypothetical protein